VVAGVEVEHELLELRALISSIPTWHIGIGRHRRPLARANRAITASPLLKEWMKRSLNGKTVAPLVTGLNEVLLDRIEQTVELDPSTVLTDEDVDRGFQRLLDLAQDEEWTQLDAMTLEQRRQLVFHASGDAQMSDRIWDRRA